MKDYLFRHSELVNKHELNEQWLALCEVEEAIFGPWCGTELQQCMLGWQLWEKQNLYNNCYDRWWDSIAER